MFVGYCCPKVQWAGEFRLCRLCLAVGHTPNRPFRGYASGAGWGDMFREGYETGPFPSYEGRGLAVWFLAAGHTPRVGPPEDMLAAPAGAMC